VDKGEGEEDEKNVDPWVQGYGYRVQRTGLDFPNPDYWPLAPAIISRCGFLDRVHAVVAGDEEIGVLNWPRM